MKRICRTSGNEFEITEADLAFYKKVSPKFGGKIYEIPAPTLCPEERERRRLVWRNERKLYKRTCANCQKLVVGIFAPESPIHLFCYECFWSDTWNPFDYGCDFDFSRSCFEQFFDLFQNVPQLGNGYKSNCENCDFSNYQNDSKNCYQTFGSGFMEDCMYTNWTYYAKSSLDLFRCEHMELGYECLDCRHLYACTDCQDCSHLNNCSWCFDCHNCSDIFGCIGLRHQKYCFLNELFSKEAYYQKVAVAKANPLHFQQQFEHLKQSIPRRATYQINCEDCSGDHLVDCKNVRDSYGVSETEDSRFLTDILGPEKDCYDETRTGLNELCYELVSGGRYYHALFSSWGDGLIDVLYSFNCYFSHDLFGCIGLRNAQYCILNKQYSKEEYEALVPRIIEHMRTTGEWGEFFPIELSPFAYNETVAQEYFSMTKEEVLAKAWKWRDETVEMPKVSKVIPASRLPDSIDDIPDDILNWAIECEESGKPFKIQKAELEFYRKMRLPIPHFHPDVRHAHRMAKRNPRKLWERNCDNCGKGIETSYAPERPEKVFCEECYQTSIY